MFTVVGIFIGFIFSVLIISSSIIFSNRRERKSWYRENRYKMFTGVDIPTPIDLPPPKKKRCPGCGHEL